MTKLTARETECLVRIAQGMTDKEIAAALFLSPDTIKTHVKHLLHKLAVRNRAHAVARGFQVGLLRLNTPVVAVIEPVVGEAA